MSEPPDQLSPAPLPERQIERLFEPEEIASAVARLATELSASLPPHVVLLSLLKGSFMFTADLVRALHGLGVTSRIEFLKVSSYGDSTSSSGTIRVDGDLPHDLSGKAVLIVDDILDTGLTLNWVRNLVRAAGADPVVTAVLLDKPDRREADIEADHVGFTIPDKFVVGYGIDYAQDYRDLPYIGALKTQ